MRSCRLCGRPFFLCRRCDRGHAYCGDRCRREGYARMFAWLIRRAFSHYESKPTTYGGPWGMDSDFRIYQVIPGWDAVEECPVFTDADRMEVTRILFRWVTEVGRKANSVIGNVRSRFNHQTFPALGVLVAGQYFDRYYKAAEGRAWLATADACFLPQIETHFVVHPRPG